jgi:hypothetical protein
MKCKGKLLVLVFKEVRREGIARKLRRVDMLYDYCTAGQMRL